MAGRKGVRHAVPRELPFVAGFNVHANVRVGAIYHQDSWTALSLLMLTGNLVDLTQLPK